MKTRVKLDRSGWPDVEYYDFESHEWVFKKTFTTQFFAKRYAINLSSFNSMEQYIADEQIRKANSIFSALKRIVKRFNQDYIYDNGKKIKV